jgi:hypothetical protein
VILPGLLFDDLNGDTLCNFVAADLSPLNAWQELSCIRHGNLFVHGSPDHRRVALKHLSRFYGGEGPRDKLAARFPT